MRSVSRSLRWIAVSAGVAVAALGVVLVRDGGDTADAEPRPAYELVALPRGIDTLTRLDEAAARIEACGGDSCSSVVFVWSPRMPLSRSAIPNVARAARMVGADLALIGFEELEAYAESAADHSPASTVGTSGRTRMGPVEALLAAGALTHAPSLAVFDGGASKGRRSWATSRLRRTRRSLPSDSRA